MIGLKPEPPFTFSYQKHHVMMTATHRCHYSFAWMDPSKISSCALDHYHNCLPTHGKPRPNSAEWTVFSAIVASSSNSKPWVVSSATGSKCTGFVPADSGEFIIRDSHAEVLCKRGLNRVLKDHPDLLLEQDQSSQKMRQLRSDTKLHLYISDAPCGDAAIYKLKSDQMNFTGAKVILPTNDGGETLLCNDSSTKVYREPDSQLLGKLRIKSGRSNLNELQRSMSHCCSDKLVRWCLLGLQQLSGIRPVRLSSIVVGLDPNAKSRGCQQEALQRAVVDRVKSSIEALKENTIMKEKHEDFLDELVKHRLEVHVVEDRILEHSKSQAMAMMDGTGILKQNEERPKKKLKTNNPTPCGFCLNWQHGSKAEVLIGARGVKQGKKPKNPQDYQKLASRLCRKELRDSSDLKPVDDVKNIVLSTGSLRGWLRQTKQDNAEMTGVR